MSRTDLLLRFPPAMEAAFEADTGERRNRELVSMAVSQIVAVQAGACGLYLLLQDIRPLVLLATVAIEVLSFTALFAVMRRPPAVVRECIATGAILCWVIYALVLSVLSRTDAAWFVQAGVALQPFLLTTGVKARFPYALCGCLAMAVLSSAAALCLDDEPRDQVICMAVVQFVSALYAIKSSHFLESGERAYYVAMLREAEHVRRLDEANAKLTTLSRTDELTGILNRRAVLDRLETSCAAEGSDVGVIIVDVDHFKLFNDHYGHSAGDDCLRAVASCLQRAAAGATDIVGRWGGEEFLIVLPRGDLRLCRLLAEQLRAAVADLRLTHAASPTADIVTLSLGYASMAGSGHLRSATLVGAADAALYAAKAAGRDRAHGAPAVGDLRPSPDRAAAG